MADDLRSHARAIWQAAGRRRPARAAHAACSRGPRRRAAIGAAHPRPRRRQGGRSDGGGRREALADRLDRVEGIVNVPAEAVRPLQTIRLHAARPAATNFPTAEGVAGAEEMLRLVRTAGPDDVALCLLSGGGSALLPRRSTASRSRTSCRHQAAAPLRRHHQRDERRPQASERDQGGRLAQTFAGKALYSLIISDVIGDPLDVIASGPTAPDPSTFADALAILERYAPQVPPMAWNHLREGSGGKIPETPKTLPVNVHNLDARQQRQGPGRGASVCRVARLPRPQPRLLHRRRDARTWPPSTPASCVRSTNRRSRSRRRSAS